MEKIENATTNEEEILDSSNDKEGSSKKKKKKLRLHEITAENDIKFRGKLSYRHFRILGWSLLILSQIGLFLRITSLINDNPGMFGIMPNIMSLLDDLMPPLFLIAAFSLILAVKDGYRKLLIMYGGFAILFIAGFYFVYWHYIVDTFNAFTPGEGLKLANKLIFAISGTGYFSVNIFIDLALCALLMFFINYTPKDHFKGKKIYFFRALALLPVLYEIGSIALKISCSLGAITLSPFVFPLLTTKAPMAFLIFVSLVLFMKFRERHFLKNGKTRSDYKKFLATNANSFHISIFLAISIAISALIDFVLLILVTTIFVSNTQDPDAAIEGAAIVEKMDMVYKWGFGKTIPLLFIIPFVVFFDYRKTYKNKLIDTLIPVVGVSLLAFTYVEGGFSTVKAFFIHLNEKAEENKGSQSIQALINYIRYK